MGFGDYMKISIEGVIDKINQELTEANKLPTETDTDKIRGVLTDQLPPYVAEMEEKLFNNMLDEFSKRYGSEPSPDVIDCIRFLAKAESVRRHTYRKLAMARLDEFLEDDSDRIFSVS